MAAFIDEVINIHQINTFVLYATIENVASVADIPNSFNKKLKELAHVLMARVFHVFSILVMMLQVSLSVWSQNILSHHFLFGSDPPSPVS